MSLDPANVPPLLTGAREQPVPDDLEVSDTGEVEGVPVAVVAALADDTVDRVAAEARRRRWSVGPPLRRLGRRPWRWSGLRVPVQLWRRSLPLRVVSTTFVASVVVLLLGGAVLMQAASQGVIGTKEGNSQSIASTGIAQVQQKLEAASLTPQTSTNLLLLDLANELSIQGGNGTLYDVIVRGPSSTYSGRNGGPIRDSVPADLAETVQAQPGRIFDRATLVTYADRRTVPGYVVGSSVPVGDGLAQVYFIFPFSNEIETLNTLQGAVITAGALLIVLLTLIAAVVSRQVVSPVRAARLAAERLASGNLGDRMEVRGTDDFAGLAISMNYMATELQKQINQLEDLSRVQQRFVSDVSHELRTPLTTVRMASDLIFDHRDGLDETVKRSAELMQSELDRFNALLTDLLEISRFDAGAAVLASTTFDLVDLVRRVVEAHGGYIASQRTEVRIHADGPVSVSADARRIERIVRNLLVNAIEHGERRPVDVLLAGNDGAVAVAVRDHGVGFEADQAKQVFHRFWRADPARARTIGGTGLGLSISMEDARLHGGWIVAWGRPGMGAQFRLTLPRDVGASWEESPLPLVPRDFVAADPEPTGDAVVTAGSTEHAPTENAPTENVPTENAP